MAQKKQARPSSAPIMLMILGSIVILAVVIWQTTRILDKGTPATTPTNSAAVEPAFPEVERISLADAKAAFDAGTAVFVDVRDSASYASAHIAGAINIVYSEIESRTVELNRKDHIITYCT
jgi:hypothetical protein